MTTTEEPPTTLAASHRERLGVPLRWWVQGTMLVASLWLALVVTTPGLVAWGVSALMLLLLVAGLRGYGAPRVEVGGGVLRAGRAWIETEHLGTAEALDPEQTHRIVGRDADARAFLLYRGYLRRAVRVEVLDPRDPAPYWLISTRRPERLAAALNAAVEGV